MSLHKCWICNMYVVSEQGMACVKCSSNPDRRSRFGKPGLGDSRMTTPTPTPAPAKDLIERLNANAADAGVSGPDGSLMQEAAAEIARLRSIISGEETHKDSAMAVLLGLSMGWEMSKVHPAHIQNLLAHLTRLRSQRDLLVEEVKAWRKREEVTPRDPSNPRAVWSDWRKADEALDTAIAATDAAVPEVRG